MSHRRTPSRARAALLVAAWELFRSLRSPVAALVGAGFLAVQGLSFWGLLGVYSQPGRQFDSAELLSAFFGGTVLSWALLIGLTSALSMRLIAEERRSGTFESLATTGVPLGSVAVGKWLGATVLYALVWAPTLIFPLALALVTRASTIDPGALVGAYLGILCVGGALIAIGLAMSAATSSQTIAAASAFAVPMALLLIGELAELVPGWLADRPAIAAVVEHVGLRRLLADLASGRVQLASLVFVASLTVIGIAIAAALIAAGREGRAAVRGRLVTAVLVIANAGLANVVAARAAIEWQLSRSDGALAPELVAVLDQLSQPIDAVLLRPSSEQYDSLYRQADRLFRAVEQAQPLVQIRRIDPLHERDRAALAAARLAMPVDELSVDGAVVFESPIGQRAIDLPGLADYSAQLGIGGLSQARAQEVIAAALIELSAGDRLVCYATGHGEYDLISGPPVQSWADIGARLRDRGLRSEHLTFLWPEVPDRCHSLVLAGPSRALSADEALAVARFLERGGGLVLALRARADAEVMPATGLELVVGEYGIALPRAIVVSETGPGSPSAPHTLAVTDGYGDHSITQLFAGRRTTVWQTPRLIADAGGDGQRVTILVRGPESAWAETDVHGLFAGRPPVLGSDDLNAAPAVAAAVDAGPRGRLVVLGSAESMTAELADLGLDGNRLLVESAIAWVTASGPVVSIPDRWTGAQGRPPSAAGLQLVLGVCAVGVPLVVLIFAGVIWWRRRRE